jgi:hypothetical protein
LQKQILSSGKFSDHRNGQYAVYKGSLFPELFYQAVINENITVPDVDNANCNSLTKRYNIKIINRGIIITGD